MTYRLGPTRALALLFTLGAAPLACGARGSLLDDYPVGDGGAAGSAGSAGAGGSAGSAGAAGEAGTGGVTITSTTTTTVEPTDVQIISESPDSLFEGETSVVATAKGIVSAAWIAVSPNSEPFIAYAFSTDDGKSWQKPISIQSPGGRFGSDPVLAADAAGNIYMTWVGFFADAGGGVKDMQVYVARAPAGSLVFEAPVVASDPLTPSSTLLDKPWITVTPKGSVVVSYASFGNTELSLIAARSTDGGGSFTRSTIISDPTFDTFYNLAYLCVSQEVGRVYTTYLSIRQFGQQFEIKNELSFSDDDGQSWPPGNHTLVSQGEVDVAFNDPTCTALGKDVWGTYNLSKDNLGEESGETSKLYQINVRHSPDGGSQFTDTMIASDPMAAPFFIHADLKHEDSGLLDLVYYAGQADEDPNGSFRRARFKFGENQPPSSVVSQPITFTQSRATPDWLGDYVGHFVRGNRMYTTYVANAGGFSHVAFASFDLN